MGLNPVLSHLVLTTLWLYSNVTEVSQETPPPLKIMILVYPWFLPHDGNPVALYTKALLAAQRHCCTPLLPSKTGTNNRHLLGGVVCGGFGWML